MASSIKIGGSANVTLDLSVSTNWELTGLDSSGRILPSLNVKIKQKVLLPLPTSVSITLPTIASLNNRPCVYNIDSNNFGQDIILVAGLDNFVNGVATLTISYPTNSVTPITASSGDNWTLPVIQEAP
jgi:hypothetical protein